MKRRIITSAESVVQSSTSAESHAQRFVQFDGKFAQISENQFYKAIRMHISDYNELPEEVIEMFGDYGITRGEDDKGYIYIDVEDRLIDADPEDAALLKQHHICADSNKYQVILYTEVW